MTKTVEATYEDGVLKLDTPVGLEARSRVRVRIEVLEPRDTSGDLVARLNEAYADAPDKEERELQRQMARLRREQAEPW
jgi:predicted DNA-binding antitoxin AbrB/MazE fold protein